MEDMGTRHRGQNRAGIRPGLNLGGRWAQAWGQSLGPDSFSGDSSTGQHCTELPWRATWRSWRSF